MNTTTTKKPASKTGPKAVTAKVNEGNFLQRMKHMFSSETAFLGELVQNARRAGATQINFALDTANNILTVTDDGHGINDFSALVSLCESDWSGDVMAEDKPFGMGLFSIFHAAKSVTFRSNQKTLKVSLAKIANSEPMMIDDDTNPIKAGTVIEIRGLDVELFAPEQNYWAEKSTTGTRLEQKLRNLVEGFSVAVAFNGTSLMRPYALSKLTTTTTPVGAIYCPFVNSGVATPLGSNYALFLQGLPIGSSNARISPQTVIVHLDSTVFTARVPDRDKLYDHDQQVVKVREEILNVQRQHLRFLKTTLLPKDFAEQRSRACVRLGVAELLNDIPYLANSMLAEIVGVSAHSGDSTESRKPQNGSVARTEIESGTFTVWSGTPEDSSGSAFNITVLQVMQAEKILSLAEKLHSDHWIHNFAHKLVNLEFSFTADMGPNTPQDHADVNRMEEMPLVRVPSVTIEVRSKTDKAYRERCDKLPWLVVPANAKPDAWFKGARSFDDDDAFCYVADSLDYQSDDILDALTDYDVEGRFDEDLKDNLQRDFAALLARLDGASFNDQLMLALNNSPIEIRGTDLSDVSFVARDAGGRCQVHDLFDDALWAEFAKTSGIGAKSPKLAEHAKHALDFFREAIQNHLKRKSSV